LDPGERAYANAPVLSTDPNQKPTSELRNANTLLDTGIESRDRVAGARETNRSELVCLERVDFPSPRTARFDPLLHVEGAFDRHLASFYLCVCG
jgi:hypothetical protein